MNPQLYTALQSLAERLQILSACAFQLDGRIESPGARQLQPAGSVSAAEMIARLTLAIYEQTYARPGTLAGNAQQTSCPERTGGHGSGRIPLDAFDVPASWAGLGVSPASFSRQSGACFVYGETQLGTGAWTQAVRVYVHVPRHLLPQLLQHVRAGLNRMRVPFILKMLVAAQWADRCDSAVLAVPRRYLPVVARVVGGLPDELTRWLVDPLPLFVRRVATGIGLAEDPGGGESFGQHRCRLLAEAWLERGPSRLLPDEGPPARSGDPAADWCSAVDARFRREGLSLERPHLNPGSTELDWEVAPPAACLASVHRARLPSEGAGGGLLAVVETAAALLVRDAIHTPHGCNWVGPLAGSARTARGDTEAGGQDPHGCAAAASTFGALGPGLLDGVAGVGLFLARAAAACGDAWYAEAAAGALRSACHQLDRQDASQWLNLARGPVGVLVSVLAANEAIRLPDGLLDALINLLETRQTTPLPADLGSLIEASAGLGALLRLADRLGDARLQSVALQAVSAVASRLGSASLLAADHHVGANTCAAECGGWHELCVHLVTLGGDYDLPEFRGWAVRLFRALPVPGGPGLPLPIALRRLACQRHFDPRGYEQHQRLLANQLQRVVQIPAAAGDGAWSWVGWGEAALVLREITGDQTLQQIVAACAARALPYLQSDRIARLWGAGPISYSLRDGLSRLGLFCLAASTGGHPMPLTLSGTALAQCRLL